MFGKSRDVSGIQEIEQLHLEMADAEYYEFSSKRNLELLSDFDDDDIDDDNDDDQIEDYDALCID